MITKGTLNEGELKLAVLDYLTNKYELDEAYISFKCEFDRNRNPKDYTAHFNTIVKSKQTKIG